MKIKIGSRGSNLALTQTKWVASKLKEMIPDLETEIIIIKTKGDKILDKALDKIGDKGLFVKELELALFNKSIDIAVHSLKDMPSSITEGLMISSTPQREDRRDVLILKEGYKSLDDIPLGGIIGTGSKRRCYQLAALRPDLKFDPVRGNIETRINKLVSENFDAIVLAAAGLHRIGRQSVISTYLDEDMMCPAPAQGALAIQARVGDAFIASCLDKIKDEKAQILVDAERAFLKYTEGGCHLPVGAYADVENGILTVNGIFGTEDGRKLVRKSISGPMNEAKLLGKKLAYQVIEEIRNYEG